MATIIDVARLAGVSKSTVSRVITGSTGISVEARRRVEEAMTQLRFVPNSMARGIRTGRSNTIAVMVPEPGNLYYNGLLFNIEAIARDHDYMVTVFNSGTDPDVARKYISWIRQRNVDGLLYCYYRDNDITAELYEMSHTMPIVFLDNPLGTHADASYVGSDGLTDIAGIVGELHRAGNRRIAFLGIGDICNNTFRFMGYRAGLTACGLEYDPSLVHIIPFEDVLRRSHFDIGFEAAHALMSLDPQPDAVIAATDMLAIGVLKYLSEAGISVPGSVSVTGYDNIHLSSMVTPSLSTIAQPIESIAREAMDILLHKIEIDNTYNRSYLGPSAYIQRESTGHT